MSEIQAEALDTVFFLAKKHAVEINLRKGDIEVFNNFAMLHARSSFSDTADEKRHMLRLWLRNEELRWGTPKGLEGVGKECYEEMGMERVWDVERSPVELRRKWKRKSCA